MLDPVYSGSIEVELLCSTPGAEKATGQRVVVDITSSSWHNHVRGLTKMMDIPTAQQSAMVCGLKCPPDIGNRVLVMFVEGNINRAFWIGCVPTSPL